jgi:PII-like signaling protein
MKGLSFDTGRGYLRERRLPYPPGVRKRHDDVVNADCLKLTTYFGERHRTEDRFVADALLDLYGRSAVEVSVLLRGAAGFGAHHHLRTDQLLTLSEDLPLVSVAVDTRERIEALLPEVQAVKRHGLITLERARMLTGKVQRLTLPEDLHEATKLTVYVGRQERADEMPVHQAVCDLLYRRDVAGATVLLGVDGTSHGARRRARFFGRNADVPLMIIAVGPGERIARVLPELGDLLQRPLLTLERITVCKRDGELLARPAPLPDTDASGLRLWQKLMIYSSEQASVDGVPQHMAIVRRLRETGARGVTVLRGVWGFHGDHAPHGDRLLQLRRHVPAVTVVIDRAEEIQRSFDLIDELTAERGLVTSEIVPALEALTPTGRRGGLRLARHRA